MTVDEGNVSQLDPFTHTKLDFEKIKIFDFLSENQKEKEIEKVRIEETFCTLVTVGGKFLETKTFKKVMRRIDEIRKIFRKYITLNFICNYSSNDKSTKKMSSKLQILH